MMKEMEAFTSIPVSIYWCIMYFNDFVGFGDITPITPLGQFIASFVMIMGLGIIAVPTGIITAEIHKNTPRTKKTTKKFAKAVAIQNIY